MIQAYTKAACIGILVSNDIHYIHFLASGEDFDKSHLLAEEYYNKINEETDYLMELAVEHNEEIINYSLALGYLSEEYIPEDQLSYNYTQTIITLINKLNIYISALEELRETTTEADVQSLLDDIIRNWKKELNYKLQRRLENERKA